MKSNWRIRKPDWQHRYRLLAVALAATLISPVLVAPPATAQEPEQQHETPAQITEDQRIEEEAAALEEAAETGEPVEILSQRSEISQVFANPEGDLTEDVYVTAQWVRQGGQLVDIDTQVTANPDGTLSPGATEVGVTFSGGGEGAMATVMRDNRSMSLTWPEPLPEPVVAQDTVTYPEVFEDVDLKLQARNGGFGQVLVVKTPEAAENPELAEINLTVDTTGLEVSVDEHGNIRALDPAGQEVFTAPTPLMWDSSTPEEPQLLRALEEAEAAEVQTNEFEPGIGAENAATDVRLEGDTLSLIPDAELLTGDDTVYPVYIDPSVEGSRHAWTIAYKKYPNGTFYNGAGFNGGTDQARVGYENQTDGTARSFFRMNTKNLLNTSRVISSSRFRIRNSWSWSCTAREVQLWRTGVINARTSWNNQPGWGDRLDTVSDAKGWGSGCPAGNLVFDTTAGAKRAQTMGYRTLTLGLRATTETDVFAWKKFDADSAVLSTTYNTRPYAPTHLNTSPVSTRNADGCGQQGPARYIGNTDFYLQAKVSDKDGGTVRATFYMHPTGHRDYGLVVNKTVSVTSGSIARIKVPKADLLPHMSVTDGDFSWKVQASDGRLVSRWAPSTQEPNCRFIYDPNRPFTPPEVTSTQFPDGSEGWPAETGAVRQAGTFTLSPGAVSDVVSYKYDTSWDLGSRTVAASGNGSANISLKPTQSGPNTLRVWSQDRAGNVSDARDYLFYVNGRSTPDAPGDINGDGNSDLWGIDGAGLLTRHFGVGDGTVHEADSPASDENWDNTLITHQGDWTNDAYDDLITLRPEADGTTHRLWVYPNDGFGYACSACPNNPRIELTVYDPANAHWTDGARQILAIGDVDGGLDTNADGTEDIPGYPDLLVNDGEFIWLYYGSPDHRLDTYRDPTLLVGPDDPIAVGPSQVDEVEMSAPGDYNEDGIPELVVHYEREDVGQIFVFNGQMIGGAYNVDVTDRRQLAYGVYGSAYPFWTAIPTATNTNGLALWGLKSDGGLAYVHYDYDTREGSIEIVSDDFAGYQYIS